MNVLKKHPLYCVICGKQGLKPRCEKSFVCKQCGFTYFHNVAAGVAAFIQYEGKILAVKRGLEPCKGMLDLPGGFVDPQESNEEALRRELIEELQLKVKALHYLFSFPNTYLYKEVNYNTVDSFFAVNLDSLPELTLEQSELTEYVWIAPEDINPSQVAFESVKRALAALVERNRRG